MTNCNKTKLKVTILNISEYIKFIKYGEKDKHFALSQMYSLASSIHNPLLWWTAKEQDSRIVNVFIASALNIKHFPARNSCNSRKYVKRTRIASSAKCLTAINLGEIALLAAYWFYCQAMWWLTPDLPIIRVTYQRFYRDRASKLHI